MRKFTTSWILMALIAVLCGVGCKSGKPAAPNVSQTLSAPSAPPQDEGPFVAHLPPGFQLPDAHDVYGVVLLRWYGAVLVARGNATPPSMFVFPNEEAVQHWQSSVKTEKTQINGITIELQTPAMAALLEARREALRAHADITPQGEHASRRSYADTQRLWASRVDPGFAHWQAAGKIDAAEIKRIKTLAPKLQTREIMLLESQGLRFGPGFDRSILTSVAPPGMSQHLSMLAIDIREYDEAVVRTILARHGWFQTVLDDLPHFTYLGVNEAELPSLGLEESGSATETRVLGSRKELARGYVCWVPDLGPFLVKGLGLTPQSQPR